MNDSTDLHYDYEYEEKIETRGKIVKWGLVGIVALTLVGSAIHSCSSRDSSLAGSNNPSYIVPASYSTNQ